MKNNIKAKLKLIGLYSVAVMMFSGCGSKHPNVVEAVSENKLLVKDIKDGKHRIIELGNYTGSHVNAGVKYFRIGDTINVMEKMVYSGYQDDKIILIYNYPYYNQYTLAFNKDSLDQRKALEIQFKQREIRQREQAKFDSLSSAMLREKQEKQR